MSYLPEVFVGSRLEPEVQAKRRQGHDEVWQQRAA